MKTKHLKNIFLAIFFIFALTACRNIQVESNDGGFVLVDNFYFSPETVVLDRNLDATISHTKNYDIEFQTNTQFFLIDLRGKNLQQSRKEAEEALLKILKITKKEACRLKLSLFVLASVNEQASLVENYKLSFCDGAISLLTPIIPVL